MGGQEVPAQQALLGGRPPSWLPQRQHQPTRPPSRRWEGERLVSAKKNEGATAYEWVSGMFDSASKSIAEAREQLCRFIAVRVSKPAAASQRCARRAPRSRRRLSPAALAC